MATSRFISVITRGLVSIVILLFAFGLYAMLVGSKPELDIATGERSLPAVVVMEAAKVPIARRTVGYGTADAIQHADVSAQVSSTVITLPPGTRVGRSISSGDLLLELDPTDYEQQVLRAKLAVSASLSELTLLGVERAAAEERAELAMQDKALSEAELSRVEEAAKKGAAKQREVDQIKQKALAAASSAVNAKEAADRFPSREEQLSASVETKRAELQLANEKLRRCRILSPIDGVIQEVDVRVGEHVSNGKRIAKIVNNASVEIPLRLPSYARSFVRERDAVSLRSAGFGKRYWDAFITRIAPEDDSQSRTMVVFVDVEQNPTNPNRIPSGLFVRGEVYNKKNATPHWVVPRRAIRDDRVLVVRDALLRSVPVAIDFSYTGKIDELCLPDFDWVVLETPLTSGDLVVVDPGGFLRDGMVVRTILSSEVMK